MSETPCPFCGQIHGTACGATTPADQTDQIATVAARPVVALDAQRYGHDEAMADIFDLAHIETEFEGYDPRATNLHAYIERLEVERDALLAERETQTVYEMALECYMQHGNAINADELVAYEKDRDAAHDNAERVIRGE